MTKSQRIAALLQSRIAHADYAIRELPPERELAEELEVSRMTARKAIQHLIDQGLLQRESTGRVTVAKLADKPLSQITLLTPSINSANIDQWRVAVDTAAAEHDIQVHVRFYAHWQTPALPEALKHTDAVILIPNSAAIPEDVADRLRQHCRRIVCLDSDLTALGIHSIVPFPATSIHRLLDHLAQLGHREIDCFNAQATNPIILSRIEQWQIWRSAHAIPGQLLGTPIHAFGKPMEHAYQEMTRILREQPPTASAIVCTTMPAAVGVARALNDRRIRIGQDISLCVINDEGLGPYMHPSLTALQLPDLLPHLRVAIERLNHPQQQWAGSLLSQPAEVPLWVGESTGRVSPA